MRSMLRHTLILVIIGLPSLFLVQSDKTGVQPDYSACLKPYLATPEPGTCLQLKVYRFLQAIERFEENPTDSKTGKKLMDLIEPRVRRQVDTSFIYDGIRIPLRIYYPTKKSEQKTTPVVLYIHGGGFIAGNLDQYDLTVKKMARVTGMIYVSAGYRLAPEYPFPAAVNDTYAAWKWLVTHVSDLGGDPERMVVMGSSAGGNLATVVTLQCLDNDFRMPDAQILFYPPTTFREEIFPSRKYFTSDSAKSYLLTREFIDKSKTSYLDGFEDVENRYLSPLDADLDPHLPPTLILTPQCDPLRDEGKLYAEKLRHCEVYTEYIEYEGMIHGFLSFWMFFNEGKNAMKEAKRFMESESAINAP